MPRDPAEREPDGDRMRRRPERIDTSVPPREPDAPSGEVGSEGGSPGDLVEPKKVPRRVKPGRRAPAREPDRDP